jgi:hypothetical protein
VTTDASARSASAQVDVDSLLKDPQVVAALASNSISPEQARSVASNAGVTAPQGAPQGVVSSPPPPASDAAATQAISSAFAATVPSLSLALGVLVASIFAH